MSEELAPGTQILSAITSAPVGLAEQEVIEMLIEQTRFSEEPEQKRTAIKLLESGHTLVSAAQKMGVRASTLFRWAKEPDVSSALSSGREYRRQILGGRPGAHSPGRCSHRPGHFAPRPGQSVRNPPRPVRNHPGNRQNNRTNCTIGYNRRRFRRKIGPNRGERVIKRVRIAKPPTNRRI